MRRRLDDPRLAEGSRSPISVDQVDGDLVEDGVCALLLAEKLGITQATLSEHMRVLVQAELVVPKRIKQWTFYRRDEARIRAIKADLLATL